MIPKVFCVHYHIVFCGVMLRILSHATLSRPLGHVVWKSYQHASLSGCVVSLSSPAASALKFPCGLTTSSVCIPCTQAYSACYWVVLAINQSLGNRRVSHIVVQSRNPVIFHFSLISETCFVRLWVGLLRSFFLICSCPSAML